ncbi:two-component regulator propeller domain-containing protein [Lutibacter sp.]|uniref:ligand-binding sensor domain-containing protein n=1 Tax=Lutibacter sp. TaxID=1925666 RepID=UPI001A24CB1C|nr:two-component regulator propeller domain-containing protein [Lutibacter sp.]MBI9039952.1 diguanylate cyclase [Lutibacter sp.]
MNKKLKLIYLIVILTLNFSCIEKKSSEKVVNFEFAKYSKTDTLKFTSGIRAIFQDSKGNYWIGSHNEGISFYDGKTFEYFTTNEGISDNQIRSIQEDKNGNIWFGTANGVSVHDRGKFTNYLTKTNEPTFFEWNKSSGDLWFYAGEEDGINRFDGKNMNYLIFPKPKNENLHNSYGVTDISKDRGGKIWIATYAALFNYDGKIIHIFDHKNLKLKDNELLHIRSVLADSKGRIWIGNNGIGVILKKGNSITHFSKEQGKLIPMNEFEANFKKQQFDKNTGLQSVFAIEEDSEGNIWFGDRDSGAWKYNGKTLTNYPIKDKLLTPMIWTIYKDNVNNLLFGMSNGRVYKFNGKSFDKQF